MTKLSKSDVKRLANLARLRLTDTELEQFSGEFSSILQYVDQLKDADTEGLKPTYQVNGLSTVTRSDELVDYKANQASLLKNVPKVKDSQIEVKRVLG
ncbi:MAG: Asp-tRNA(Asn)/Glu-tRNA(Gln) amidotransferase subunit GatC [Patescibacteria group bacterium]